MQKNYNKSGTVLLFRFFALIRLFRQSRKSHLSPREGLLYIHYIIYNAVCHRRQSSVNDDRPCNGKNLHPQTEDESLAFIFHGGGNHRIGKSGYGNKGSASAEFCDFVIDPKPGEHRGKRNKGYRARAGSAWRAQTDAEVKIEHRLANGADSSAYKERTGHVAERFCLWNGFFAHFFVFIRG